MALKLLFFEINYYRRQVVFWLGVLYAIFAGSLLLTNVPNLVYHFNSPYSIIDAILKFSAIATIFISGFYGASTLLRDSESKLDSIIFTTPIDKFQFLIIKFMGLFIVVLTIHIILLFTLFLSTFTLEDSVRGPFSLLPYIYGLIIFIIPNVLLCTSIIFSTALLKRKMIPIYIVTLLVFLFYVIASMLGNSPLMAMSTPFTQEGGGISSLLDPYAIIPFFEQSAFWSIQDKNELLPTLKGSLLYNRLIWLTIAISAFAFTYSRFKFTLRHEKDQSNEEPVLDEHIDSNYVAKPVEKISERFDLSVFLSKLIIEYKSVVKGTAFIVILLLVVGFNLITLFEQISRGPVDQSPYYPLTQLILELLQDPLSKIGLFIAIFYSVELYWSERSHQFDMIVDSSPIRNSVIFLAKFSTVTAICFTVILVSVLTAIGFQLMNGYFDIEPMLYLRLFYYSGSLLILHAGLTLFLQRFAPNKAVGLAFGISIVFYPQLLGYLEIASPMTIFAYRPYFIFSDMTNTIFHDNAFKWLTIYWSSFVAALSILTIKYWKRGQTTSSEKLSLYAKGLNAIFIAIFIGSGSHLYHHYFVLNERTTREDRIAYKAYYEKTYSKYETMNQPTITHIDVDVDIYPSDRRYIANGSFIYKNKSTQPIDTLMISIQQVNTLVYSIDVPGAKLISENKKDQVFWYKLDESMSPNDSSTMTYSIDITRSAFSRLDGENYVTAGGSYFELEDYLPFFGYLATYELRDKKNREDHNLEETSFTDPKGVDPLYTDNWIYFKSRISTSSDQVAVTVGNLVNKESINDRRIFSYETDQKIKRVFPIMSAEYDIQTEMYNDIEISIYHAPKHYRDNDNLFEALKWSIDYFETNFAPYDFKNFKIVELPYFSSEQSFGAAFPGMYSGVENRFFNLDHRGEKRNSQLRGVSHEFSHQYWGGYVTPNPIGGFPMLTEVLSKYSELVIQEKHYGKYSNNASLNKALDIYLRNRTRSSNVEKPLSRVDFSPMIYYMKGLHSMTALREQIGEEKINLALRNLISKYRHPVRPTSLHLMKEFYAVADSVDHPIIRDLFERVVTHDFSIELLEIIEQDNEFETTITISAIKYVLDESTNTNHEETIHDHIEIAFYSDYPDVENQNMTHIEKVFLNETMSTLTIKSKTKPAYIVIDPNKYRIDPSIEDNMIKVQ